MKINSGNNKKGLIIAIDGPAGSGKTTTAKKLAKKLKFQYLDTGAMYRAVAYFLVQKKFSLETLDIKAFLEILHNEFQLIFQNEKIFLNGKDITSKIRTPEISEAASKISAQPEVRSFLTEMQRKLGSDGNVVLEGRDIGTVVFPKADFKFYLDASAQERAKRRFKEMQRIGLDINYQSILSQQVKRDQRDSSRSVAPLKKSPEAFYIDTSELNPEQVVNLMLGKIKNS